MPRLLAADQILSKRKFLEHVVNVVRTIIRRIFLVIVRLPLTIIYIDNLEGAKQLILRVLFNLLNTFIHAIKWNVAITPTDYPVIIPEYEKIAHWKKLGSKDKIFTETFILNSWSNPIF